MTKHGGKRLGAGRKPTGNKPKRALGVKVSEETHEHLDNLIEGSTSSKAAIVEYAILRLKKLPKYLE